MIIYNDQCVAGINVLSVDDETKYAVSLVDGRMNSRSFLFACDTEEEAMEVLEAYMAFVKKFSPEIKTKVSGSLKKKVKK